MLDDFVQHFGEGLGYGLNLRKLSRRERWLRDLWVGYVFKELISLLLDDVGYEVYPYGFETFLPALKRKLYAQEISSTPKRIRSTPDLLVRDPDKKNWLRLLEVKARNQQVYDPQALADPEFYEPEEASVWRENFGEDSTFRVDAQSLGLSLYQEYWPESILVLVVPSGKLLYARSVSDIPQQQRALDPAKDFLSLQQEFPRLQGSIVRKRLLKFMIGEVFGAF